MQREATVQGEVHAAETDTQALLQRGLDGYDAVVVEGRSPTLVVRNLTLGYATFLMGYVSLMWLQSAVSRLRGRLGERTSLKRAAESADVAYHDRIDADTAAVYEMAPRWTRWLLGGGLLSLLVLSILVGVSRPVLVLFTLSIPQLYATLTVVIIGRLGSGRAVYMAESITQLADDRAYDRVAVVCGDAHREAIGEALRAREWVVETHKSRHPLRRLLA